MTKKIIVNNKEYKMPKMSIGTYQEYLNLTEELDKHKRYTAEDIEAMSLFVCKAYGDKFTVEELQNEETGLDAVGLISEFMIIDANIGEELSAKLESYSANFQENK